MRIVTALTVLFSVAVAGCHSPVLSNKQCSAKAPQCPPSQMCDTATSRCVPIVVAVPDMAMRDLAVGSDLPAPDLASAGDLPPADMATAAGLGASCAGNGDCASNFCVDGYCCNAACDGQCQACDITPGQCAQVSGAPHGARTACSGSGACAGACGTQSTACDYPGSTTSCGLQMCANSLETLATSCDASGACSPAPTTSCGAFLCSGNACPTSCTGDGQCVSPAKCISGMCQGTLANAAKCGGNGDCSSGFCVDGVCCNSGCTGQCQACDVTPGTCTQVSGAPHGARTACTGTGSSCGGTCGTQMTACDYPTTSCRSASCAVASNTETLAAACSKGACPTVQTMACGLYACGASACNTICSGDGDCAPGDYCNTLTHACQAQAPNGHVCGSGGICATGNCVDGVCCDTTCTGQCQACDVSGAVGTCTPIASGTTPHGNRSACAGGGTVCAGSCNGSMGQCQFPGTQCAGATCGSSTILDSPVNCSQGTCPAPAQTDCSASGLICSGGACVKKPSGNYPCSSAGECASNNCIDGYCCNSTCTGQCQACDVAGSEGMCTPIAAGGAPHLTNGRSACTDDGHGCGGSCDGTDTGVCGYRAGSCSYCATAIYTFQPEVVAGYCSLGTCTEGTTHTSCGKYECNGSSTAGACLTGCCNNSACFSPSTCSLKVCKVSTGTCE